MWLTKMKPTSRLDFFFTVLFIYFFYETALKLFITMIDHAFITLIN